MISRRIFLSNKNRLSFCQVQTSVQNMNRNSKQQFVDEEEDIFQETKIKSPRLKIISLEFSRIKTNFKKMYNNSEYSDVN